MDTVPVDTVVDRATAKLIPFHKRIAMVNNRAMAEALMAGFSVVVLMSELVPA